LPAGEEAEMLDPVAELIRIEVRLVRGFLDAADRVLAAAPAGSPEATIWSDYGFKWPAYALAHLHGFEHPENPFHGDASCLDTAIGLLDKCTEEWHWRSSQGLKVESREVPHYVAAALIDWLGERVPAGSRVGWTAHAEAWAGQALEKPFGFTGTYHDAWRLISLYRLGRALDREEWREMAAHFFRQMISYQTPEGFWEEGRHHGPSMRYNGLMLPALAWIYRLTGEGAFRASAARLATFMATYSYPDGITAGPFDGRNCPMMAFFPACPGMELSPEGRALSARAFGLWRDLGSPENPSLLVESTRDAVRLAFYAADLCVYLTDHVAPEERAAALDESGALPVDGEGTVENHSTEFDGLLHRSGDWVLALSGQNTYVPKISRSVYRLERQSRIELWHARARLVLGGGHNLRATGLPYANAVLDTGYAGASDFGRVDVAGTAGLSRSRDASRAGGAVRNEGDDRQDYGLVQSYFIPQLARARAEDGSPGLELRFAHGTVLFGFAFPAPDRVEIEASWDVRRLKRLCLQMPLLVWHGAGLSVDGGPFAGGEEPGPVGKQLRVEGGPFAAAYGLTVPAGAPCRVRWPLAAHPTHTGYFDNDPFVPAFRIAMVSSQWDPPPRTGTAQWTLRIS
jgi:hypothetical protein